MKAKLRYLWDNFEGFVVTALFAIILLTVFVQVLSRILLNNPLMFTEELARYVYVWMVFFGFSRVTQKGTNVRLVFISEKITGWKQDLFQVLIGLFSIGAFLYIGYWSIPFIRFQRINIAPAMEISMAIIYLFLPISMVLCFIRSIERMLNDVKTLKQRLLGESQPETSVS